MNNIALGQYLPLNSIVHRMDPRAKIAAMLIVMIAIFIPAGYSGYAVLGIVVCAVAVLARLRISFVWRAMRPMLFMLVFLLIVNLLVIHEGYVLFSIGSFRVYSGAVSQTLYIVIRLALMVTITTILTATTKPLDLTLGIEDLLKPFQKIGLPAHEIAMMISIALRFIPTLIEETQRIMKAQVSIWKTDRSRKRSWRSCHCWCRCWSLPGIAPCSWLMRWRPGAMCRANRERVIRN